MASVHVVSLEQRVLFSSFVGPDLTTALDPDQRFSLPSISPTAAPVALMVAGDFNGDHNVDLVVRSAIEATLRFYAGDGTGKFAPRSPAIGAGANPTALAVGDFNKDHKLDIAVANNSGPFLTVMSSITILLGNGDGTFTKGATAFGGQLPTALAVGDVNHDGATDIIVANGGIWSPPLTEQPATYGAGILLGNGDGTFQMVRKITLDNPQTSVAAGDVNGDGRSDVVLGGPFQQAATPLPLARMWTAVSDADTGGFKVTASSPFAGRFGGAVLADLNGDHNDDVAALQLFAPVTTTAGLLGDGSVHTLLSNGDGTFTHKAVAPTPINRAAGIDAADFNGDGKLDFIVAGSSVFRTPVASIALTGAVAVIPGLGGGSLGNANVFRIGALPAVQAIADVNNDGLPDIITGGPTGISVLLNRPKPAATDLVSVTDDVLMVE